VQQRLIPDEDRAGSVEPLAKANPRGEHAIDPRRAAIGTHEERSLQAWHEILRLTENEAGGEKDRGVSVDVLKDLVDHASFREWSSGVGAQECCQPLLRPGLAGSQGACERGRPSSRRRWQQLFRKGPWCSPDFQRRVHELVLDGILAQRIGGT
jgi:hypothetical protein